MTKRRRRKENWLTIAGRMFLQIKNAFVPKRDSGAEVSSPARSRKPGKNPATDLPVDGSKQTGGQSPDRGRKRRIASIRRFHRKAIFLSCVAVAAAVILIAVFVPGAWNNRNIEAMAKNTATASGGQAQTAASGQPSPAAVPSQASAAAVSELAASPQPSSIPSASDPSDPDPLGSTVFQEGMTDPLVGFIQQRLMDLNFMEDAPTDNSYGSLTKASVMLFQRQEGLPMDGKIDSKTYTLLMSPDAPQYAVGMGASGADVQDLISRLYDLGYLSSTPDTFTAAVKTAVQKFQQTNGLAVDGTVGTNTKELLYSSSVKPNLAALSTTKIMSYQKRLKELGYLTTPPDGTYGADTVNAVKRFQNLNGLVVDGYFGPDTVSQLNDDKAQANALVLGMSGSDITRVQKRLSDLNFIDSVTGYYGSVTRDAVKAFQKKNGLSADGKVGQYTMNELMASSAKSAGGGTSANSGSGSSSSSGSNTGSSSGSSSGSTGSGKTNNPPPANTSDVENFIAVAKSKLGSPYILGAKGPNTFDCSGFVYWCLNHSGVTQSYMTSAVWQTCSNYQRINGMSNLQRGDVISFKGHVGIYLGNGSMISALNGIEISNNIQNSAYWTSHFVCGFRIF